MLCSAELNMNFFYNHWARFSVNFLSEYIGLLWQDDSAEANSKASQFILM